MKVRDLIKKLSVLDQDKEIQLETEYGYTEPGIGLYGKGTLERQGITWQEPFYYIGSKGHIIGEIK